MKLNCWDYMNCGREVDGKNAAALGVCPAWSYWTFHSTNNGFRAGRYCWIVAGTFREGKTLCTNAAESGNCSNCDFYRLVKQEEGCNFVA